MYIRCALICNVQAIYRKIAKFLMQLQVGKNFILKYTVVEYIKGF